MASGWCTTIALVEASPYVPRAGCTTPEPKWKRMEAFSDVLPREPQASAGPPQAA